MGILSRKAVMKGPEILVVNKETASLRREVEDVSKNILYRYGPVLNGKNYTAQRIRQSIESLQSEID